jgi:hypothetical protein
VVQGWPPAFGPRLTIEAVDADRHRIQFATALPLGLASLNVITCTALDATSCRVQYG